MDVSYVRKERRFGMWIDIVKALIYFVVHFAYCIYAWEIHVPYLTFPYPMHPYHRPKGVCGSQIGNHCLRMSSLMLVKVKSWMKRLTDIFR